MISTGRKILILLISSLQIIVAYAQVDVTKYELGAAIGAFIYQGDLTPARLGSYKTVKPGVNLYFSRLISPSFSLRANLAIGALKGDDAKYGDSTKFANQGYRLQRNFKFHTPVIELSVLGTWNPLRRNYQDRGISPYVLAGAGFAILDINRDWSQYNAEYFDAISEVSQKLAIDSVHPLPVVTPVVPVGIGIRYGITPRIAVSAEATYRFVFTDYLDGFSQAANPELDDHYYTITVGVIYRLGKKNRLNCPPAVKE